MKHLYPIICVLCFTLTGSLAQAETINLSVAASMTDVFKEIISHFSRSHPQIKLQPNFASSGSLARQIEQGAPADLYISANQKWMDYLVKKQFVDPDSVKIFACNSLVFVGTETMAGVDINNLSRLKRIALGTPDSVPAGQYAKQAMVNTGVFAKLESERKLILAKDVRQALLYADRGEVDGAFVYKTDASLAERAFIIFTVPENLHDRIAYPIAITRLGRGKQGVEAFHDFIISPDARTILEQFGFQPGVLSPSSSL